MGCRQVVISCNYNTWPYFVVSDNVKTNLGYTYVTKFALDLWVILSGKAGIPQDPLNRVPSE